MQKEVWQTTTGKLVLVHYLGGIVFVECSGEQRQANGEKDQFHAWANLQGAFLLGQV